jgi:two-component system chemotaxis response regulator CheB
MKKITSPTDINVIVIGTSSGGVEALSKILPSFKKISNLSCAVVIHLPPKSKNLLPSLIGPDSEFKIKEAESGEKILPHTIYIAPSDYHLCMEPNGTLSLSSEEPIHFSRPAIDMLFESAAYAYNKTLLGILLTGSSSDGAQGLKTIKELGGLTIVQDPKDSVFPIMPQAALNIFEPDYVLSINEISDFISNIARKGRMYGTT